MSARSRPDRRGVEDAAARLAASQHGVITRAQAREAGMTRSMVSTRVGSRRWIPVHPGTYRIHGAPETWRQRVVAACLTASGPASHDTAMAILLDDGRTPLPIEVITSVRRRPRVEGVVVHRTRELGRGDACLVDAVPLTRPHRALLDVAGRYEPDVLERLLDELMRRGASIRMLDAYLRHPAARTRKGAGTLRRLVAERLMGGPPESDLETAFLQLLRSYRVPQPVPQHEVRDGRRLVARVDFAYPELRVAVELDGYRWHAGRARFDADRVRQNALEALGWTVLRFTWTDVHERPEETIAVVWSVLGPRLPAKRGRPDTY